MYVVSMYVVILLKIHFVFSVEISVLGYPEPKKCFLENICVSVANFSVLVSERIFTKFTPNMNVGLTPKSVRTYFVKKLNQFLFKTTNTPKSIFNFTKKLNSIEFF